MEEERLLDALKKVGLANIDINSKLYMYVNKESKVKKYVNLKYVFNILLLFPKNGTTSDLLDIIKGFKFVAKEHIIEAIPKTITKKKIFNSYSCLLDNFN